MSLLQKHYADKKRDWGQIVSSSVDKAPNCAVSSSMGIDRIKIVRSRQLLAFYKHHTNDVIKASSTLLEAITAEILGLANELSRQFDKSWPSMRSGQRAGITRRTVG